MEKFTFNARVNYLIKKQFQFVGMREAESLLKGTASLSLPVLLTIDDGWKNTHQLALPILKSNRIPHIIYLYTDIYEREIPVLNVLLQYALWKTGLDHITWGGKQFDLQRENGSETLLNVLLFETAALDKQYLHEKLSDIFKALEVDYSLDGEWKYFSLLTQDEIDDHLQNGGSFQLHTHHHINPLQDDLLSEELTENQRIIEDVTGQKAEHFCYPSGVYSRDNFPLLKKLGIKSAVTCIPGLNDKNTHPYELKRFLDGDNISQIEFEAEMSGFMDFVRKLFRRSYC